MSKRWSTAHRNKLSKSKIIHGMTKDRFYTIWITMKARCYKPKKQNYYRYGGRGIIVCNEWHNFEQFRDDMYQSYLDHVKNFGEKNTSLERINNDGNYSKENCRWATQKEQCNNTKRNQMIKYGGEIHSISEWASIKKIKAHTLRQRIIESKWEIKDALNTKVRKC